MGLPGAREEIVTTAILGRISCNGKSAHIPPSVLNDCGRGAQDQSGRRKPGMHNGEPGVSGNGALPSGAPVFDIFGISSLSEPFSTVDTCSGQV